MRSGRGIAAEAIVEILVATDRLRLRQWVPADREPFARLNGDPRVMEHFPAPLSRYESDGLVEGTALRLISLGIARVCLVVLATLYLAGGVAAVSGFFQMRAGPADLSAWFSSNGVPPSRFLFVGIVYCAVGMTGI